jgi:hypothetical protein
MRQGFTEEQHANFYALRDCPSAVHNFERLGHGDSGLRILRCSHCGGLVGQSAGRWYQRGIIAHSMHPLLAISTVPPWLVAEHLKDIARMEAQAAPEPMPLPDAQFLAALPPQTRDVPTPPWSPKLADDRDD